MRLDLRAPCAECPFRSDIRPYLHPDRARGITDAILRDGVTFTCHKHLNGESDEDKERYTPAPDDQHCAGAMILLQKMDRPNQIMQVASRLGLWSPDRLKMDAPVFASDDEMVEAMRSGALRVPCDAKTKA